MATITVQDINVQSLVELDTDKLNSVKGGCPICIPLVFAAAAAAGYYLNR